MKETKLLITTILISFAVSLCLGAPSLTSGAARDDFDAVAFFKAKCAMCHGAKSEKKFDASLPEDELVQAILKGKEGTPKMPEYGSKGIDQEKAAALVAHMRSLRQ